MPTYEYRCEACGKQFEKFQSITSDPIRKCPKCGKNKVRRLISSGAAVIFKGSGFYITDYRDASYKDKAKADTGGGTTETKADGDKKTAADATAKPETKPAAEAKPQVEAKKTPPAKKK